MSQKRRDTKGRILNNGESQRTDGRYLYKYIDTQGKPQSVYSWRLVSTDKLPAGKRPCRPLRDLEKEIQRDLQDGIDSNGKKLKVWQLYQRQIETVRPNVKPKTKQARQTFLNRLKADKFGNMSIENVKPMDSKAWVLRLREQGYAYRTIESWKRSLTATFGEAVRNGYLRMNPFEFKLSDLVPNDTKEKQPLTDEQAENFLAFLKTDPIYSFHYDTVLILLKTGLRISELCGLTLADVDLENRILNVDHQLLWSKQTGYFIGTPKTEKGIRQIPLSGETVKAFQRVIKSRPKSISVDGYTDFLFSNKKGGLIISNYYTNTFKAMGVKYNKCHEDKLPNITPHILRHTFCTHLANNGMNPKSLQYVMGHSNISITLNCYAHFSMEKTTEEIQKMIA